MQNAFETCYRLSAYYQRIVNAIRQVVNFVGLNLLEFPEYKVEFECSTSREL
jgi:hypothetical protein